MNVSQSCTTKSPDIFLFFCFRNLMLDFKLGEAHLCITLNLPIPSHSSRTPGFIKKLQGAKKKVICLQDTFSHLSK